MKKQLYQYDLCMIQFNNFPIGDETNAQSLSRIACVFATHTPHRGRKNEQYSFSGILSVLFFENILTKNDIIV